MSVRQAAETEARPLAAALAAAFDEDPVFRWMVPMGARRAQRLRRFFQIELEQIVIPQGEVWATARMDGAALCLPPERWRFPPRVALLAGRSYGGVFGTRMPRALAILTLIEHRHYRPGHYYIPYIGVVPERQGQGFGTALLEPILERCERERLPAYLEATSERNAALYARLGFERLDELRVHRGPPVWPMLRQPG